MNEGDWLTMQAYVDREMTDSERRSFEARLFTDLELMAKVRKLRAQNQLLQECYAPPIAGTDQMPAKSSARRRWFAPVSMVAMWVMAVLVGFAGAHLMEGEHRAAHDTLRTTTLQQALETVTSGESVSWRDETTKSEGTLQPVSTYRNASGGFCREFEESWRSGGIMMREGGLACREQNGQWRVRIRYFL